MILTGRSLIWASISSRLWTTLTGSSAICSSLQSAMATGTRSRHDNAAQNHAGRFTWMISLVGHGLDAGIAQVAGLGESVDARYLSGAQLLLQALPVLHCHQLPMCRPECPTQRPIADPQAGFDFFWQEYYAILE